MPDGIELPKQSSHESVGSSQGSSKGLTGSQGSDDEFLASLVSEAASSRVSAAKHGESADKHGESADKHGESADKHGVAAAAARQSAARHGENAARHAGNVKRLNARADAIQAEIDRDAERALKGVKSYTAKEDAKAAKPKGFFACLSR